MLVLTGLCALAGILLLPGLIVGPSLDAFVFIHVAERLRDGAVLYVDAWDHKPPGIYLVYAAASTVLPWIDIWVAAWLLSVVATAGAGYSIAVWLRRLDFSASIATVVAVVAVAFMAQYLLTVGGGLTESVGILPLAAALAITARPGALARVAIGGGLLGTAILLSLQLVPGAVAIAGIALAAKQPGRSRAARAISLLGAACIPGALVGAWLAANGAIGAALDALIAYNAAYRTSNAAFGGELSGSVASWTVLSSLFVIGPALFGVMGAIRLKNRRWVLVPCGAWLLAAVALIAYQGRFFAHYAIPLMIPLAPFVALGIDQLATSWRRGSAMRRLAIALPVGLILAISLASSAAGGRNELISIESNNTRMRAAVSVIEASAEPGETILVWGNRPGLYVEADRAPAIPFSFFFPLATEGWASQGLIEALVERLEGAPPALVVDAGSRDPGVPGFLPLLIDRPVATEGRELDLLEPMRDFVRERYHLLTIADGWPIYVRGGTAEP